MVTEADQELIDAAIAARENAFAPYSGYKVGAAVRTASGRIFTGCNVEISSFSHTCCAERVAVFKAVSEGERELIAAAVITIDAEPGTPCGACRQVLFEFGPNMDVWLSNLDGVVRKRNSRELIPDAFGPGWVLPHIQRRHGREGERG
jgi:cytidine deaminase